MASAAGVQGADSAKLADQLAIMPTIGDFLSAKAESGATSGLTTGAWGSHTSNINTGTDYTKLLIWAGVGLFAYLLIKRLRGYNGVKSR